MKGMLDENMNFLIFLIVILLVIGVLIGGFLLKLGSKENLSRGCTGIVDAITSLIKQSLSSSEKARLPNAIWC